MSLSVIGSIRGQGHPTLGTRLGSLGLCALARSIRVKYKDCWDSLTRRSVFGKAFSGDIERKAVSFDIARKMFAGRFSERSSVMFRREAKDGASATKILGSSHNSSFLPLPTTTIINPFASNTESASKPPAESGLDSPSKPCRPKEPKLFHPQPFRLPESKLTVGLSGTTVSSQHKPLDTTSTPVLPGKAPSSCLL